MSTQLVPPLILILGVLGSIFAGIATPTEAAGAGAFIATMLHCLPAIQHGSA
jgi:TRAP-type mannitol/chloroaromatic compound transport system permease large subunit